MVHKFSDFAKGERKLVGDKVSIDDILGKELEFTGYRIQKSKVADCDNYLTIQFKENDKYYVAFTSSVVLEDQFKKYAEKLPFVATIKHEGRYFTLT